jgi:hypothetical protein
MGCQHLDHLYELFLLGSLSDEEGADLRKHLERHCEHCLARIREAVQTIYLIGLTVKPARLDPKLKTRLLQRLRRKA